MPDLRHQTPDTDSLRESLLLTGCAGFIGVNLVQRILDSNHDPEFQLWGIDKLTYAANKKTLKSQLAEYSNYHFVNADICSATDMASAITEANPTGILHLAAESHVDTSIGSPAEFIHTNVVGTYELLTAAQRHFESQDNDRQKAFRFLHVSTDEVFGQLDSQQPAFTEESQYQPNSPYSASKAASDHFVRAWHHTYGLPTITTHCSNNYGPHQHAEKLIPTVIRKAIAGEPIPVYGTGKNVRDWVHVTDHADAIMSVLGKGVIGETYNIGGNHQLENLTLVKIICDLLDKLHPQPDCRNNGASYHEQISFVTDRLGHDFRYAVDASKIRAELGWQPTRDFATSLRETVAWYVTRHGERKEPQSDDA